MTMTRVVIDAQTWANLRGQNGLLELCDPSGRVLAYYQSAFRVGSVEGGKICSPYTDEEIEELHHQTGGQTLADFWKEHGRQ
jgi:hypothetical protein